MASASFRLDRGLPVAGDTSDPIFQSCGIRLELVGGGGTERERERWWWMGKVGRRKETRLECFNSFLRPRAFGLCYYVCDRRYSTVQYSPSTHQANHSHQLVLVFLFGSFVLTNPRVDVRCDRVGPVEGGEGAGVGDDERKGPREHGRRAIETSAFFFAFFFSNATPRQPWKRGGDIVPSHQEEPRSAKHLTNWAARTRGFVRPALLSYST